MVKKSEFERGDIVLVGFDLASGHEQQGAGRLAFVLPVQAFNQLGMTLAAPITQGGNFARCAGFSAPLHCEKGDVHGVALVSQVWMMGLHARLTKRIGLAVGEVMEEALLRLQAVVEQGVFIYRGHKKTLTNRSSAFRVITPEEPVCSLCARRR